MYNVTRMARGYWTGTMSCIHVNLYMFWATFLDNFFTHYCGNCVFFFVEKAKQSDFDLIYVKSLNLKYQL